MFGQIRSRECLFSDNAYPTTSVTENEGRFNKHAHILKVFKIPAYEPALLDSMSDWAPLSQARLSEKEALPETDCTSAAIFTRNRFETISHGASRTMKYLLVEGVSKGVRKRSLGAYPNCGGLVDGCPEGEKILPWSWRRPGG